MFVFTKTATPSQPIETQITGAGNTSMPRHEVAAGQPTRSTATAPRMDVPITPPGNPLTRTPPAQNPLSQPPIGTVQESDSRSDLETQLHRMENTVERILPQRLSPTSRDGNGWDRVSGASVQIYPKALLGRDIILIDAHFETGVLAVTGGTVSRVNSDNGSATTVSIRDPRGIETDIPSDRLQPDDRRNVLWVKEKLQTQREPTGDKTVDTIPLEKLYYVSDAELRSAREYLNHLINKTGKWREVNAEEHATKWGGDLYLSHFIGKTVAVLNEPGTGTAEFLAGEITDLRFVLPPHQDQYGRPSGHYEMTIRDARTGAQIQIRNVENFYLPKQEDAPYNPNTAWAFS